MKAEEVLDLYESFWFEHSIIKRMRNPPNSDQRIQKEPSNLKSWAIPTVKSSSMSDNSFKLDSFSPNSVLPVHSSIAAKDSNLMTLPKRKRTRKIRKQKSLPELELEEVKGFMDLGFVFSEEDRHSSLASIIPGLQRLGKKIEDLEDEIDESTIQRPYLSETWEVMERKKQLGEPLMKWRFLDTSNEVSMKDNLKWWAQVVASIVK